MSDPELVDSNPGKHESCPILPRFPGLSESAVVAACSMFPVRPDR